MMPPADMSERVVVVKSPSVAEETGLVLRALFHIALWTTLVMVAHFGPGATAALATAAAPGTAAAATTAVNADEVAYRDLDPDAQRIARAALAALADAEASRARDGRWPDAAALAARGIAPFAADPIDRAGYRWRSERAGLVTAYVGTPAAPATPTFALVVVEPEPGTPIDPQAVRDDQHHILADGSVLHVALWRGPGAFTDPTANPPFEQGWRRVVGAGDAAPTAPATAAPATAAPAPTPAQPLRIGVTLHPYYSWTANVVANIPGAEVVPLLPGNLDADNFSPSADDIATIATLDAIVINGIGHDDFIRPMIKASGNPHLAVIEINTETPLVKSAHGTSNNSHTFISFTNAMQQTRYLATQLAALRPAAAAQLAANATAYIAKLRAIQQAKAAALAHAKIKRVITVHDGYTYLLQEFGIDLAGVVQPAHGLTPSAKELGEMIELIKKTGNEVVLTEEDFPEKLLATLRDATHVRVYIISHIAAGTYSPDEFATVMTKNADTLIQALVTDPQ